MERSSAAFKHFDINKDYSGKLVLRMEPDIHREIAKLASRRGLSINQLLNLVVMEYIDIVKEYINDED